MAHSANQNERKNELVVVMARAFVELGYRKATTAELARRCGVQENILYRLWPDKKAMFISAIHHVYDYSEWTWLRLLAGGGNADGHLARRILEFEAEHHGKFGHYRIIFTGLAEADDAEIGDALRMMFVRFQRFLMGQIMAQPRGQRSSLRSPELTAWAAIGLGTIANIGRELGFLNDDDRRRLIAEVGGALLKAVE